MDGRVERAHQEVCVPLDVASSYQRDESSVLHGQEGACGEDNRDCETRRDHSDEQPGIVHHGVPFMDPSRSVSSMSKLYGVAIPGVSTER